MYKCVVIPKSLFIYNMKKRAMENTTTNQKKGVLFLKHVVYYLTIIKAIFISHLCPSFVPLSHCGRGTFCALLPIIVRFQ